MIQIVCEMVSTLADVLEMIVDPVSGPTLEEAKEKYKVYLSMPKEVKGDAIRGELRRLKNREGRRPLYHLLTSDFLDGLDEVFKTYYTEGSRMYAGVNSVINEGIYDKYVEGVASYISRYFVQLGKDLEEGATAEEKLVIGSSAGRMYLWLFLTPMDTVTYHGRMPLLTSELLRTIFQGLDRIPDAITEVSLCTIMRRVLDS